LLRAVCSYLKPKCKNCSSKEDCLYYALYIRDRQKRGKSQPVRPIVFIPPFFGEKTEEIGNRVEGKGELTIEINVFGDYIRYLPHIIYGLRFLGKVGLNRESKYELDRIVDCLSGRDVYDGESVKVNAIKPVDLGNWSEMRPKHLMHKTHVLPKTIEIHFHTPIEAKTPINLPYLIHMVRRRLILYVNEYGNGDVPEYTCDSEILDSIWRNHKLIHYSKRQGRRVFYGITGKARYIVTDADENALKILTIGEHIGAGAKSSFGMGFFKII
jgi:CRISPR-associated endoribonuclease Cas6